jgi:cell division protein FtsL
VRDLHKYRDGMPVELRVTLMYITAAIVLTAVIVVANSNSQSEVNDSIQAIEQHIDELTEACSVGHDIPRLRSTLEDR